MIYTQIGILVSTEGTNFNKLLMENGVGKNAHDEIWGWVLFAELSNHGYCILNNFLIKRSSFHRTTCDSSEDHATEGHLGPLSDV